MLRAHPADCYDGACAWRWSCREAWTGAAEQRVIPALLWLIERLARRHTLHVFALSQEKEPGDYPLLGAQVHNLGMPSRSAWPGQALLLAGRRLFRGIARHGPFDVVHAFWANNPGFLAALAARRRRLPLVVSLGGGELVGLRDIEYGSQLLRRERLKVRWTLRSAARVHGRQRPHGRSRATARHHSRGRAARRRRGILRGKHGGRPLASGVLHVGSLNRIKDQATLLRAFRRVVDVIPDDAPRRRRGGRPRRRRPGRLRRLGLTSRVTFHGFLPSDGREPSSGARTSSSSLPATRRARSSSWRPRRRGCRRSGRPWDTSGTSPRTAPSPSPSATTAPSRRASSRSSTTSRVDGRWARRHDAGRASTTPTPRQRHSSGSTPRSSRPADAARETGGFSQPEGRPHDSVEGRARASRSPSSPERAADASGEDLHPGARENEARRAGRGVRLHLAEGGKERAQEEADARDRTVHDREEGAAPAARGPRVAEGRKRRRPRADGGIDAEERDEMKIPSKVRGKSRSTASAA